MSGEKLTKLISTMGYSEEELIKGTSLSPDLVKKLLSGEEVSLSPEDQKSLEDFLCYPIYDPAANHTYPNMIQETAAAYGLSEEDADEEHQRPRIPKKKPGEYTLEDYMAIPEDYRVELIDGNLYEMEAPGFDHQLIGMEIFSKLKSYIDSHKGNCIPCAAPADILLDNDDRTVVQPDVFVICDRNKITRKYGLGAPDLVIEVLSPSTRKKDMNLKRGKYQCAGVREYWMIDPDKQKVIVEVFEGDPDITIYSFADKVPVYIFHGDCEIDFAQIWEQIRFLYD